MKILNFLRHSKKIIAPVLGPIYLIVSMNAFAATTITYPASPEQTSTFTPVAVTQRTMCQLWTLNSVQLKTPSNNVVLIDPNDVQDLGSAGQIIWDSCIWGFSILGHFICVVPAVPPPWIGAPWKDDGWTVNCPLDHPYLVSFREIWAGYFGAGGYATVDQVHCAREPNNVDSNSLRVWQSTPCQ